MTYFFKGDLGLFFTKVHVMRFLLIIILFSASSSVASTAYAQTHATCQRCHQIYIWKTTGAGLARDHVGLCPNCKKIEEFKDKWHLWFFGELNENRYLYFKDGTIIDLKHYRGSMILGHYLHYVLPDVLPGNLESALVAYGIGWGIEMNQQRNGHPSGHPDWTNEDMLSNSMGILFSQTSYVPGVSEWTWNKQSVSFLESIFGPIQKVTDKNPNKR